MVSQHSWLCPDDKQGIDWQHSMASAGVVIPKQSTKYAAIAVATSTSKSVLPKRICFKLDARSGEVKFPSNRGFFSAINRGQDYPAASWAEASDPIAPTLCCQANESCGELALRVISSHGRVTNPYFSRMTFTRCDISLR